MKRFKKNKLILFSLLTIVLISVFFRFYKLSDLFYYSLDEEVISFHVAQITSLKHFPAIGVNAADTGLYLGPGYFYLAAPFFWLFKGSPLGGAVMSGLIGVGATLALYWAGKTIINQKVGLIAAFIHASSLTISLFERKFFNPQPGIFLGAIILGLTHLAATGHRKAWWLLALALGLIFHFNLSLVPYCLIVVIYLLMKRPRFSVRTWLIGIGIIGICLAPLMFFDLRHHFQLTRSVIQLVTHPRMKASTPIITKITFPFTFSAKIFAQRLHSTNIVAESTTCSTAPKNMPEVVGWFCLGLALAGLGLLFRRTPLIPLAYGLGALALIMYPGRIQEYYGFSLVPALLLGFGYLLSLASRLKLAGRGFIVVCLAVLLLINLQQLLEIRNVQNFNQLTNEAVFLNTLTKTPYSLQFVGNSCYGYGFDYLMTHDGNPPTESFTDPILGWLKPKLPAASATIATVATVQASENQLSISVIHD